MKNKKILTIIELKSADNFEIVFSNKKPTDRYDYYRPYSK